ncbi:hypothetical protein BUALT_Bualt06G0063600 [Buddleja alternifolia]|uniref:Uncharacterized protein n=1 Tax=Buddleja alternifolia TaxID=168488 RepID=A0AAV6XEI1_9LAMI|nr:hypothetical protein BUALT_Bualt06G0063600 [Buddleja alternifolia]
MIAKALIGATLTLQDNFWRYLNFSWALTSFALSSLNNTLLVGVPLLKAMYGAVGKDLVVQSSVMQSLLWFALLLFILEFRHNIRTYNNTSDDHDNINSSNHDLRIEVETNYSLVYNFHGHFRHNNVSSFIDCLLFCFRSSPLMSWSYNNN